jgi:hypothetical protein
MMYMYSATQAMSVQTNDSLARSIMASGNRSVQFVDELIERRDVQNDNQHTLLSCERK